MLGQRINVCPSKHAAQESYRELDARQGDPTQTNREYLEQLGADIINMWGLLGLVRVPRLL